MEKKKYERPVVLSVEQIRFETAPSGPSGGGFGSFLAPPRTHTVDFTIPLLPKSGDFGSH